MGFPPLLTTKEITRKTTLMTGAWETRISYQEVDAHSPEEIAEWIAENWPRAKCVLCYALDPDGEKEILIDHREWQCWEIELKNPCRTAVMYG